MHFLPILLAAGIDVTPPLISNEMAMLLGFVLVSSAASAANALLRRQKRKGKRSGPVVLFLVSVLNLFAANLDQTARQLKAAKEPQ